MKQTKKLSRKVISYVLALVMVLSTMTGIVPGMSLTAQAAEEVSKTFTPIKGQNTYSDTYFTMTCTNATMSSYWLINHSQHTITIKTNTGDNISKVVLTSEKQGWSEYHISPITSSGTIATQKSGDTTTVTITGINANEVTIEDAAHAVCVQKVSVYAEVNPKTEQTVTAPTAATDLTYKKDQAQALLTSGASVTTGNTAEGSVQYKVGVDGTWSTEIPKGTNAGTYNVYYKVLEDDTYAEYAPENPISVTIAKADPKTLLENAYSAQYGQQAKDIELPTGWSWLEPETKFESTGGVILTATFAGDDNYNAKAKFNISVLVGKAVGEISYVTGEVTKELNSEKFTNEIKITGDATPTYTSSAPSVATVDENGLVTIKGIGEATITANVANDTDHYTYETRKASYKLTVNPISTVINTAPTAAEITYGQKLSDSTLTGGVAKVAGSSGTTLEGEFAWKEPDLVPNASNNGQYDVVFTPTDTKYAKSTCQVTIKVNKQTVTLEETQKPVAKIGADLYYTGSPIELITAPTSVPADYTIMYSTDGGSNWSADLPTGTAAGNYTVKVKYVSQSGNYENIQLGDNISVTITVDKSILGKTIQEATKYKNEITDKNTDNIYADVISDLEAAISTAETANNNEGIDENGIVSAIDALTTALNKAKADVEKIDNHKAFDEYKESQKTAAGNKAQTGDSTVVQGLITTAQGKIDSLAYDDSKSLDENKAAVDAIINKLEEDLTDQRAVEAVIQKINAISDSMTGTDEEKEAIKDALAAYDTLTENQKDKISGENKTKLTGAERKWVDAYKTAQKNAAGALVSNEDSEAAKTLVTNAQKDIDNITYDQSKGLDVFKAAVDAIITKVTADVADQKAADPVITQINALPDANQVKTEDKDKIEAARAAYNALTDGQKSKVSAEILTKLTDAEAALEDLVDAAEAKKVTDMIDKLPSSDKVTLTDKESIEAARAAYNALTEDQKAKVTPETLKKLTDDEDRLKILQVMSEVSAKTGSSVVYTGDPIELINTPTTALPTGYTMKYAVTTENVKPTDENLYTTEIPTKTEVGTYYVWYKVVGDNTHTDSEPDCVTVTIEEQKQNKDEAVDNVIDLIDKLPESSEVTVNDKEKIEAARMAYDALTDEQKGKIPEETLKKLTDAEAALAALQNDTGDTQQNPDGTKTVTKEEKKDNTIIVTTYDKKDKPVQQYIYKKTKGTSVDLKNVNSKTLKKVIVPETVKANGNTYKVTRIRKGFLKNCKQATNVFIGKYVHTIDKNAFKYGKKVKIVTIDGRLDKVGKGAFKNTKKNVIIKLKNNAKNFKKNKKLLEKSGLPKDVTVKRVTNKK